MKGTSALAILCFVPVGSVALGGEGVVWRPTAPPATLLRPVVYRAAAPDGDDKEKKSPTASPPSAAAPVPVPAADGRDVWGDYGPPEPGWCPWAPADVPFICSPPADAGCGKECCCTLLGFRLGSWYFRGEALLWDIKDSQYPVLLTTAPSAAVGGSNTGGFLGDRRTRVLFGGGDVGTDPYAGGRFTTGLWFDCDKSFGIESSTFFLGERGVHALFGSAAFPVLARPFFSLNSGSESAEIATLPGSRVGTVRIDAPSRLWGTETNFLCNWCCGCWGRVDTLAGLRYLDLREGLHITEELRAIANTPTVPAGTRVTVADRFDTRNRFFGGQVGLNGGWQRGPWSVDVRGTVGIGNTRQTVTIVGSQLVVLPNGAAAAFPGGLLALPTNAGRFTRDRFSFVPEVGVTLGYDVRDWMRLTVGYNFLYWTNVARPADQIDRVLDETNIPNFAAPGTRPTGFARPAPTLRDTDFWAQGLRFGLEFRW